MLRNRTVERSADQQRRNIWGHRLIDRFHWENREYRGEAMLVAYNQ